MEKIYNEQYLSKKFKKPLLKAQSQTNNQNKNPSNFQLMFNETKEISTFILFPNSNPNKNSDFDLKENQEKEKDLNLGRFYLMISALCFSLYDVSLKITVNIYPNFNFFLIASIRFLVFSLAGKIFIIKNGIKTKGLFYIENKFLFLLRIISAIFVMFFLKLSFQYIRFGLAVSISLLSPIWANFLSIYFFKEKFELKYIISCVVCLLGTYLIGLGENNNEVNKDFSNTLIGIFFGLTSSFFISICMVASKGLLKVYNSYELIYLLGFYSFLISFLLCIFQYHLIYETCSLFFIFMAFLTGFSDFLANYFSFLSFGLAEMNKISYIFYMRIILSLISGFLFFNDNLHLYDLIGGGIIIAFNYLTTKYLK